MQMDLICLDHNYTKHHAHLSSDPKCPARYLFMNRPNRIADSDPTGDSELIDVCESESPNLFYKPTYGLSLTSTESEMLWEEKLDRSAWSSFQHNFFDGVINVLKSYQLATGILLDRHGSSVKRHLAISKASLRLLKLIHRFCYNGDLILWLHHLLKECSEFNYCWIEIISFCNVKYRGLFEKMQILTHLGPLVTKAVPDRSKPPHLPFLNGVVVVVIPPKPHWFSDHRYKAFVWYLAKYFQIRAVKPTQRAAQSSNGMTVRRWLRNLVIETRSVIKKSLTSTDVSDETADNSANKTNAVKNTVVLLGWGSSAILACQLAHTLATEDDDNPVSAVVSICPTILSFAHGLRGHAADGMAPEKLHTPIMFVTGQMGLTSNVDDIEDFRDKLASDVKSKLVVVGGADDRLRLCCAKQTSSNLSQPEIDVAVVEEIHSFISTVHISGVSSDAGIKGDAGDASHGKSEIHSGTKRSISGSSRGHGIRAYKTSRMSVSQPTNSIGLTSPSQRGNIPPALSELSSPSSALAPLVAQPVQISDQVEVTCHDYAASSLPVSAISVGSSAAAVSTSYSTSGSEQSLRYMLSAGAVSSGELPMKRLPTTSSNQTQRGPGPIVYRKKLAPPVVISTAAASSIVSPEASQLSSSASSSTSSSATSLIVSVNNPSNVFVLSSHAKSQ